MLRIRQKRRTTFARPQTQASSSKSAVKSPVTQTTKSSKPRTRHACNDSTSRLVSQQTHETPVEVSNRQRRLASLFLAFMASSPLPIEANTETLEAAHKASIASRTAIDTKHKQRVRTVHVQEVKAGRWRRFRYGLGLKRWKGKTDKWNDIEMNDMVELRGESRAKGRSMDWSNDALQ